MILLSTSISFSQINRGRSQYELFKYEDAIVSFKKVISKSNSKDKQEATNKIAHCYRLTRDNKSALLWYSKAVKYRKVKQDIYFYYAISLRGVGRYKEAAVEFKKIEKSSEFYNKSLLFIKYCEEIKDWRRLKTKYSISTIDDFNSEHSEYSPVVYKKKYCICK